MLLICLDIVTQSEYTPQYMAIMYLFNLQLKVHMESTVHKGTIRDILEPCYTNFVINKVNDYVWTQIMTIYFQTISHVHVNITALFIRALVTADCSRYDIYFQWLSQY